MMKDIFFPPFMLISLREKLLQLRNMPYFSYFSSVSKRTSKKDGWTLDNESLYTICEN